jgi:hypothetical protein
MSDTDSTMTQSRFRLAYALELVFVVAVGLALFRAQSDSHLQSEANGAAQLYRLTSLLKHFGDSFPTGVAIAGLLGLWIEVARKRSPAIWGFGRWTWSVAGLYFLLNSGFMVLVAAASEAYQGRPIHIVALILTWLPWYGALEWGRIAWGLVAIGITRRLARVPPDPAPDAREWAGRIFAVFLVVWTVAEEIARAFRL